MSIHGEHELIIGKIDHVAINCINIQKSLDFYGRILGFKQLQTVECDGFDIIYIALPKGGRLELFDYHGKSRNPVRKESDSGLRHLAFQVEDVLAHERLLIAEGVTITLTTRDLPNLKSRVLLFLDPDGTVIEFCERNTK